MQKGGLSGTIMKPLIVIDVRWQAWSIGTRTPE
jgi:hypothetical protein